MNLINKTAKSRHLFTLFILFFSVSTYSQNKKEFQPDSITVEKLSQIISKSISSSNLEDKAKEIDLYILLDSCVYQYNMQTKTLDSYLGQNLKEDLGNKDMTAGIIYVTQNAATQKERNTTYLYGCNLANNISREIKKDNLTIISRASVNKSQLALLLGLDKKENIIISQIFGYL